MLFMATVFGKRGIIRTAIGWFRLLMENVLFYLPGLVIMTSGFHLAAAILFLLTQKIAIISVMMCVPVSTVIFQQGLIFARDLAALILFPNRQLVLQPG